MSGAKETPPERENDDREDADRERARQGWMELFFPGRISAETWRRRRAQWDAGENRSPTPADKRLARASRVVSAVVVLALIAVVAVTLVALWS